MTALRKSDGSCAQMGGDPGKVFLGNEKLGWLSPTASLPMSFNVTLSAWLQAHSIVDFSWSYEAQQQSELLG